MLGLSVALFNIERGTEYEKERERQWVELREEMVLIYEKNLKDEGGLRKERSENLNLEVRGGRERLRLLDDPFGNTSGEYVPRTCFRECSANMFPEIRRIRPLNTPVEWVYPTGLEHASE